MKKKTLVLLLFVCFISLNCKEKVKTTDPEQKSSSELEEPVIDTDENFTLNLDVVVDADDTFTMFYLYDEMKAITKEKSVSVDVIGSDVMQNLKFQLKEKVLPTRILLKFKNETQNVKFVNANLTYKEKEFKIEGSRFFQFFNPNQDIEYDRETSTATAKKSNSKFNPTFSSRKVLEDKIDFHLYM